MSRRGYPPEPKVIAASGAASLSVAVSGFIIWALGVWKFGDNPQTATVEGDGVPEPVALLVIAIVATIAVYLAGYNAPHQHRRQLGGEPQTPPTTGSTATPSAREDVEGLWSYTETRRGDLPPDGT